MLEEEHVEHAKTALAESKAKVQARRKEQSKKTREEGKAKTAKPAGKKPQQARRPQAKSAPKAAKPVETRPLTADEVKVGNAVNVNMGKGNMAATIVEINKEDVRVQLSNGLQMVVKAEHLRA
ncbi:ProQ: influences osmotic activation of compatible solute ProP [Vibrio ponticus]|nr:ProQ: influences osmotic activation of compatible solute ProP [Vibrio ponticus]